MRLSVFKWKKKVSRVLVIWAMPTWDRRESVQNRLGNKMVKKYLEKPALGKSAGPDDILRRVLKELADVIT